MSGLPMAHSRCSVSLRWQLTVQQVSWCTGVVQDLAEHGHRQPQAPRAIWRELLVPFMKDICLCIL